MQRSKRLIKAESKSCFLLTVMRQRTIEKTQPKIAIRTYLLVAQITVVFFAEEKPSTF